MGVGARKSNGPDRRLSSKSVAVDEIQILCKDLYEKDLTLNNFFDYALSKHSLKTFIQYFEENQIKSMSFKECHEKACRFIKFLISQNIPNDQSTIISLIVDNSHLIRTSYQAIATSRMVALPMYKALSNESIIELLQRSKSRVAICDDIKKIELLIENSKKLTDLCYIVSASLPEPISIANSSRIKIFSLEEIVESSSLDKDHSNYDHPNSSDRALIFSTSGSTGHPKLAVHTHSSVCNSILGASLSLREAYARLNGDTARTYQILPEQHILAYAGAWIFCITGGTITYPSNRNIKSVMLSDLRATKPNTLIVVPLLLNRIKKTTTDEVEKSLIVKSVFKSAYNAASTFGQDNFYSSLVFKKIRASLGGNVQFIMCAGAFLDSKVQDFIEKTTRTRIIQCYGLTECLATVSKLTFSNQKVVSNFHCGQAMQGVKVFLKSVPEMGYFQRERRGEICLGGSNLFSGYLNANGEVESVLNGHGFLETGDIGEIDIAGNLKIIDRKRNIFKLPQGEFVCPTHVEEKYLAKSVVLKDIFVYGNIDRPHLVAIGFVEETSFRTWLEANSSIKLNKDKSLQSLTFNEMLQNDSIVEVLQKHLNLLAKSLNINGYELVRNWTFRPETCLDSRLLTVTMKHKRQAFELHFASEIDSMYRNSKSRAK